MFRLFENINQQYCAGRVTVSQGVFLMKLSHKKDAEGNVKIEIEASEGLNVIQQKMIRKAFKMKVYPDKIEEYTKRHNPIWSELEKVLKDYGVHNYSIFLDAEAHLLFGYAEIESEEKWSSIAETEICKKWWKHMADLMETNKDDSPVSHDLKHIFHM